MKHENSYRGFYHEGCAVIPQSKKVIPPKFITVKIKSSCPEVFCKNGVLRNFGVFTGKNLCQSLF